MAEPIKVEGQRIRGNADGGRNFSRRHPLMPGLHQHPIDFEPMLLCERRQRRYNVCFIHVSTIIELM